MLWHCRHERMLSSGSFTIFWIIILYYTAQAIHDYKFNLNNLIMVPKLNLWYDIFS